MIFISRVGGTKKKKKNAFSPNTREAETGGGDRCPSLRPAWSTERVPEQPGTTQKDLLEKTKTDLLCTQPHDSEDLSFLNQRLQLLVVTESQQDGCDTLNIEGNPVFLTNQ